MKSKVVLIKCDEYNSNLVYNAINSGLNELGGIEKFVKKEDKILVKPNFLYPSESSKQIITNPTIISSFLKILNEHGYQNVLVGDSPANGSSASALQKAGLRDDLLYGAKAATMNQEVKVHFENGKVCKDFYFTKEVSEADAIIGLCKMKTHMLERITGAVKNMYGLICGKRKAQGHVSYKTAVDFAKMLCDIHNATPQRLHIMDAIIAMEGNGPGSGTPTKMGLIIMSSDPVAIDTVFSRLVYLKPELVPTITQGVVNRLGTNNFNEIDLTLIEDEKEQNITIDELVNRYGKKDFDVQRDKEKLNILQLWSRLSGSNRKPHIDETKCIKCGVCVDHCPVDGKAVNFKNGKDKPPVYDYKKCIRCYCCQELCPQKAISVK